MSFADRTGNVGVVHGRFQILHFGHMEYLMEAKRRSSFLIVGIANPDPSHGPSQSSNSHRALREANPLSYFERLMMISEAMVAEGLLPEEFAIVPFPIDHPQILHHYAPPNATYFLTIFDEWGREKKRRLEALGLRTNVLYEQDESDKSHSTSEIRRRIVNGEEWEDLVPSAVYQFLKRTSLDDRITTVANTG